MRISFIVRVYNSGKWIPRCIESIKKQGINEGDYELLIVDDGSPDKETVKMCDSFEGGNIVVIHQKNSGPGSACNTGIRNAKGDYIWFVDADDSIVEGVAPSLLEKAEENDLDVLGFDCQLAYEDENLNIVRTEPYPIACKNPDTVISGRDFFVDVDMPSAQWCALLKRSFVLQQNLLFVEGIYYEDQNFTPRAYYLAERAMFTHVTVINYVQREGSMTKNPDRLAERANDWLTICDTLYAFVQERMQKGTPEYNKMMTRISFNFSQSLRFCSNATVKVKNYTCKPYYPLFINPNLPKGEKIKYRLINISIPFYLFLHKALKR